MKKITLTRNELYKMVWTEPLTIISRRFHVTYSDLREIYRDLNIPIPESAHWSKLQWGKSVKVIELPDDNTCLNEIELFEKEPGDSDILPANPANTEVGNTEYQFKVPSRLTNPDILITKAREYFEAVHKHDWRSNSQYPKRKEIINIDVRYENLSRALRIFDTVIKALRTCGHDISFDYDDTVAMIYGEKIEMRLREINKVSDKPRDKYSSRVLEPTGRLIFMIGRYQEKTVTDGRKSIEDRIDTIISKLEAEGKQWHDWRIKSEIQEKERQKQIRIEQEARARREKEISDFKSLYIHANRQHQAKIMRYYISLVEETMKKNGQDSSELMKWVEWARKKIDWYDPLINAADETFTEDDKTDIFQDLIRRPTPTH